ncbi:MAG: DUF4080 domain-containing protein [Hydrogenophilales bacterium]|nr:DUF4080 domain-containing protein [Hydrogenophilales bacterium]
MADILLTTLNARYFHAALGLRYLVANLGELESQARIMEFILQHKPADIVEALLAENPAVVGFGVYIWNVQEITQVVAMLKRVVPEVIVVLGGPEVSHECGEQAIVQLADYVITGWGDISFAALCRQLLAGERPAQKIIAGEQPPLSGIKLPYRLYNDDDIAHRFLYVEASRGCPFKCEFCLSALDKTAWPFDLDLFLAEMARLHARGARTFKFVDRTFNLNIKASARILEFFLARLDDKLFVHFEVIPDHLPDTLKALIARFPPGTLQLEAGIQTFNPEVQARISRRHDDARAVDNLRWLRAHSNAHLHVDLIFGLPGEDMASFGAGFDKLIGLNPHEIQIGILKRLRGAPIARHTEAYGMRYSPYPPYNILATGCIDFPAMQRLTRFARYWDMIANSGRFPSALPLILGDAPFTRFLSLSDWLYAETRQTHRIALDRLYDLVHAGLVAIMGCSNEEATHALARDYAGSGARGAPAFLKRGISGADKTEKTKSANQAARQLRHLAS